MKRYTREQDNLDELCYRTYGNTDNLVDVINANPDALYQPILPLGIAVEMPELPQQPSKKTGIKLWD
ncbi:tail protein X [Histophilus somni]|uniref:tail protein X n=1 Tax=Histophilus somni TaxID=731 RepID=UPI00201F5E91|nr:tail protein X [Histophilus somni]